MFLSPPDPTQGFSDISLQFETAPRRRNWIYGNIMLQFLALSDLGQRSSYREFGSEVINKLEINSRDFAVPLMLIGRFKEIT